MPVAKPKRQMSRGICSLCGQEFSKNTIARHVDKCWAELTGKEKHDQHSLQPTKFFRLVVSGRYRPEYWLYLDVRAEATLDDLDHFLRRTWLECCGHLSTFTIGGAYYSRKRPGGFRRDDFFGNLSDVFGRSQEPDADVTLAEVLSPGLIFAHEYDYGDTTELKLRVLSEHEEPTRGQSIHVLARNLPPFFPCDECGAAADWIGPYDESYEIKTLCESCLQKNSYDDEMLLPIVNSPRTGVCGYTGATVE